MTTSQFAAKANHIRHRSDALGERNSNIISNKVFAGERTVPLRIATANIETKSDPELSTRMLSRSCVQWVVLPTPSYYCCLLCPVNGAFAAGQSPISGSRAWRAAATGTRKNITRCRSYWEPTSNERVKLTIGHSNCLNAAQQCHSGVVLHESHELTL